MLREEFKGDEHLFFRKVTKKDQEEYEKHVKAIDWRSGKIEAKGNTKKMYENIIEAKGLNPIKPKAGDSKLLTEARKYAEAVLKHFDSFSYTHSRILTGEIGGVPYKAELDFDGEGKIVDLKTTKNIHAKYWSNKQRRYLGFAEYYGYDIQKAVYNELWRQNFEGPVPEYYLLTVQKSEVPLVRYIHIPDCDETDKHLKDVEARSASFAEMKMSPWSEGIRCEECDWCKQSREVSIETALDYRSLI